jgi:hypothetical protein
LSLKSIIKPLVFLSCISFNATLKSSAVLSQNKFNAIYHIFSFSKIFVCTEGIIIFCLVTSFSKGSNSHDLNIVNLTFVQAVHFISLTASYRFFSFKSSPFALVIKSQAIIQEFFAGESLITILTTTQKSVFSTTAPIHSKSHDRVSSKDFFSVGVIYSLCLSQREFTIQVTIQETISSFFIPSIEKYSFFTLL